MPQAIFKIAELAEADSSLTVTQSPFVLPGALTLSLLHGRWPQRIAASEYFVGDARKPVDVRLGQHVIDHEFHQISRGEPHGGPTAGSLNGPQKGSHVWVVRDRHASHHRRDRLGLLSAEDGPAAEGSHPSPIVPSAKSMHAVFDHHEDGALRKSQGGVHVHWNTKRVLQQEHSGTRSDATLCIPEIDVVILQAAVHVDGSGAGVADCIGHDNVGRDGEQNLTPLTHSEGPQKSIQTDPRAVKADRVFDAHRASEGLFVLLDLCSLDKLCGCHQIAQGLDAISPSSRPSKQSQTARQMQGQVAVHKSICSSIVKASRSPSRVANASRARSLPLPSIRHRLPSPTTFISLLSRHQRSTSRGRAIHIFRSLRI